MSKNIRCDSCEKNATVHLTQIIHGKVHKVDLCEECAQQLGVTDPGGFSVSDLLGKSLLETGEPVPDGVCDNCGYTQVHFKKSGRLGCADCYEAFSRVLQPILKSVHREVRHIGKVPHQALKRRRFHDSLMQLENELRELVREENYERAAEVRDSIRALKQERETREPSSESPNNLS